MERIVLSVYLLVLSVYDGRERRVPVICLIAGIVSAVGAVVYRCCSNTTEWKGVALTAILGTMPGVLMLLVAYITGKAGYGDGLTLLAVGILAGYGQCMVLLSFSLLLMSMWCVVMLLSRRGGRDTRVPYIPFLTAVYFVGAFI